MLNQDILSQKDKKEAKKTVKLNNAKESVQYIRYLIKQQGANNLVKVTGCKMGDIYSYSLKIIGRHYLLTFPIKSKINDNVDVVLTKIQKLLKVETTNNNQSLNRQQRKRYLKEQTNYFQNKKKMNLYEWAELVRTNIKEGNEKNDQYRDTQVKKAIEFFIDRETDRRELLNNLGYDKSKTEKAIDKWYSAAIKDGSFMSTR